MVIKKLEYCVDPTWDEGFSSESCLDDDDVWDVAADAQVIFLQHALEEIYGDADIEVWRSRRTGGNAGGVVSLIADEDVSSDKLNVIENEIGDLVDRWALDYDYTEGIRSVLAHRLHTHPQIRIDSLNDYTVALRVDDGGCIDMVLGDFVRLTAAL